LAAVIVVETVSKEIGLEFTVQHLVLVGTACTVKSWVVATVKGCGLDGSLNRWKRPSQLCVERGLRPRNG
jgi:hypothetical protein